MQNPSTLNEFNALIKSTKFMMKHNQFEGKWLDFHLGKLHGWVTERDSKYKCTVCGTLTEAMCNDMICHSCSDAMDEDTLG